MKKEKKDEFSKCEELRKQYSSLNDHVGKMKEENTRHKEEIKILNKRIEVIKGTQKVLKSDDKDNRVAEVNGDSNQEVEVIEICLMEERNGGLQKELDTLRSELVEQKATIDKKTNEVKVLKDPNNEITKEINTLKKQVGEYEVRLDTILTEYDIKDKSLINLNKYVEDLKLVIQKLELKIVRMRKEDKEDAGLTGQGSSGKEERDNEEEAVEDMTERESSSKTKGTQ